MTERDWLDSTEFKDACARYWITSVSKFERIDDLRNMIRARYRPDTSRTIKALRKEIAEKDAWIATLTEKR